MNTRTRKLALRSMLPLGVAALCVAGCSKDECSDGEHRCSNTSMPQKCIRAVSDPDPVAPGIYAPGRLHWVDEAVCADGTVCVQVDWTTAVCAFSTQPIQECQNGGSVCWQGSVATCKDGYPTFRQTCDAGTCKQTAVNGNACSYCDDGTDMAAEACASGPAAPDPNP
jgi:hypothetical protein